MPRGHMDESFSEITCETLTRPATTYDQVLTWTRFLLFLGKKSFQRIPIPHLFDQPQPATVLTQPSYENYSLPINDEHNLKVSLLLLILLLTLNQCVISARLYLFP